jgi:hypothetical protein
MVQVTTLLTRADPALILLEILCVVFVSFLLFLVERIEGIETVRMVPKLALTARDLRESL